MPWRTYTRYRRPLFLIVVFTALLQLAEVLIVEIGGLDAGRQTFGTIMNWYALALFVGVPSVFVWHAVSEAGSSSLAWGPYEAFLLGFMLNATTGPVLLVIGVIGVIIRALSTGWSAEVVTIAVGSAAGFVLALLLGGAIGWVVFRLVRLRQPSD